MKIGWDGKRAKRHLVLATALSFMLMTAAIVLVYDAPVAGYEYSVYESTPLIFWIAMIVCLMIGILTFIVFYSRDRRMCGVGLFEVLLTHFVLVSLYLYRGFVYLQKADSLSYIGYAKDVVLLDHIPPSNYYPMGTILMVGTGETIGQSMVMISQLLPAVFTIAYTLGMLCWARTLSPNPQFVTSMMLAATPILFAWFLPSIFYQTLFVLMMPLFFFILWRLGTSDLRMKLLLLMMFVFFTLGHPLVAMGVLVIFASILGAGLIIRSRPGIVTLPLFIISILVFLLWISTNALLLRSAQATLEQLMGLLDGTSTFGTAQAQAATLGILSALQSLVIGVLDDLAYMFLVLLLAVKMLRGKWRTHPMVVMMACFIGGSVFLLGLLAFTFTHNLFRMVNLNFIMILAIPLVGYLLYAYKSGGRTRAARVVTVLIAFALVSTVLTTYQDPIEVFPNGSITLSEIEGSNWLIAHRGEVMFIHVLQTAPWRYADLIHSNLFNEENPDLRWNSGETSAQFRSFLDANLTLGMNYLVFSSYDVAAYTRTWASTGKFRSEDFRALKYDGSVNKLYANHCFTVYSLT